MVEVKRFREVSNKHNFFLVFI